MPSTRKAKQQLYRTMEVIWDATARTTLLLQKRAESPGDPISAVSNALHTGAVELTTMVQPSSPTQIGTRMTARRVTLDSERARRAVRLLAWDHLACLRSVQTGELLVTAERFRWLVGADGWTSDVIRQIETAKSTFFAGVDARADMMAPDSYSNLVYGRLIEAIIGAPAPTTIEDLTSLIPRSFAMALLHRDAHEYWLARMRGDVDLAATSTTYMNSWLAFSPPSHDEG